MLTQEAKDYIISSYHSGKTVYEIADELKLKPLSVYNVLHRVSI